MCQPLSGKENTRTVQLRVKVLLTNAAATVMSTNVENTGDHLSLSKNGGDSCASKMYLCRFVNHNPRSAPDIAASDQSSFLMKHKHAQSGESYGHGTRCISSASINVSSYVCVSFFRVQNESQSDRVPFSQGRLAHLCVSACTRCRCS